MALGDLLYANGFDNADPSLFEINTPTISQFPTSTPRTSRSTRYYQGTADASGYFFNQQASSEVVLMMGFRANSLTANDFMRLISPNGTTNIIIGLDGASKVRFTRNGTVLSTGSLALSANTWYWLWFYFLINDTTGKVLSKIDGATDIALTTGLDTRNDAAANGDKIDRFYMGIYSQNLVDDFAIFDATGTTNNGTDAAPAEVTIPYIVANGKGDTAQFTPKVTSVSRWYFPRPDSYPADVQPTPDSQWDKTIGVSNTPYYKGELAFDKSRATAITDNQSNMGGTNAGGWNMAINEDGLIYQYVSPPIAAQTISGTLKGQISVWENSGAYDARMQMVARVVSGDGQTVRGVLYAGDTGALASEILAGGWQDRKIVPSSPVTLSSVAASAGDRIVIELGFRAHAANANMDIRMRIGDTGTDLPENETDTSTSPPWIEFGTPITLDSNTNWAMVDDPNTPNDTIDYIETVTNGNIDLENLQTVSGAASIKGIVQRVRMWRDTAGAKNARIILKSGGTVSGASDVALSTTPKTYSRGLAKNPVTSADFTQSEIDALQAGAEVRS